MDLDEFVASGLDRLLRFAHALTGDRATAEDVVQEVLLRLFVAPSRPGAVSHIDAYARRMVLNEYLSWGRKWFRIRPTPDIASGRDPADHAARLDDRDELRRELARLPRRQRAVLVMRFYGAMTDTEMPPTSDAASRPCARTPRAHWQRCGSR